PVGPLSGVLPLRPGLAQVEVAGNPGGRLFDSGGLLGLAGVQSLGDPLEAPVVREAGATSVGGERALLPGGRVEREHVGLLDELVLDGHRGSPPLGWPGLALWVFGVAGVGVAEVSLCGAAPGSGVPRSYVARG